MTPLVKRSLHCLDQQWHRLLTATVLLGSCLQMSMPVLAQTPTNIVITNQASYTYTDSPNSKPVQGMTNSINSQYLLIDPLGQITGCAGEVLSSYQGFSIGVYDPNPSDPTGTELGQLVALTETALPRTANLPVGLAPNTQNSNPFFLTDSDRGVYNFQLDVNRGQLEPGRSYILLVNPPPNSIYSQRRLRLVIGARSENTVAYTAISLDGKPISATDGRTSVDGVLPVGDAAAVGLVLAALNLRASICQAQDIQIIKTGDRSAAEPGDTVIYRLSIKNLASSAITNLSITDVLPLGFRFVVGSQRGEIERNPIPISAAVNGSTITFTTNGQNLPESTLTKRTVLNIAYAVQLTPDAIRGSGQNSAIAQGQRIDNRQPVKDGPAIHRLRIRSGILSDAGTIIGRVFVDQNFDGEQQSGEPGVPNAVVFLDDGTRITTDVNGLFSVANVLSGYRTGVLDLTSLNGYTLAPNLYFSERNSQSRLVHLEPGGLVRMNFAVTPAARQEVGKP